MKTVDSMNMKFGAIEADDVYIMRDGNAEAAICYLMMGDTSNPDYNAAIDVLTEFYSAANEDTGYTVSVWFDE